MKSMTGYGKGDAVWKGRRFRAEARSLNHKALDIRVRVARGHLSLEADIMKKVKGHCLRGSIDVSVDEVGGPREGGMALDLGMAKRSLDLLKKLRSSLKLQGDIRLDLLLTFRDMFLRGKEGGNDEGCRKAMLTACERALEDLDAMRRREGRALGTHIRKILGAIKKLVGMCEGRVPDVIAGNRARLSERVADIMGPRGGIDQKRLEQEIALLAEKHDVSEEVERLKSHLAQTDALLIQKGPVGVKMGFLFQEMAREAGTLTAKAGDGSMTRYALDIRTEIEKAREQVQNIE